LRCRCWRRSGGGQSPPSWRFVLCLVGQLAGAVFEALDYSRFAVMVHELFVIGSGMALVRLLAMLVFRGILPRLGIVVVRIAEDISVLLLYAAFILARLALRRP
jgi:hypothetical protein